MSGDEEEDDILPQTRHHRDIVAIENLLLDEGVRRRLKIESQTGHMSKEERAEKLKEFDEKWIKDMNTELNFACRCLEAWMVRTYNFRMLRYEYLYG